MTEFGVVARIPSSPADRSLPPVDLTTGLAGVRFPNPVFTASGCSAAGQELAPYLEVADLGAVVTKSIMLSARSGRPTPRLAETPSGMLNSIGLQGPGIDAFLERDLPWLAARGARAVVSIAADCVEDYARLAARLRGRPGLTLIEVNISCPNVEAGGTVFATNPDAAAAVMAAVRRTASVPVFAKLSPDVTDIVAVAEACVRAGADGLSLINTLLGLAIDTDTLRPVLGGTTGGLSGPAIRPIALRCVWQVRQALPEIPIMGIGGIRTGLDALQFLAAGASAVQVGTAIFGDPSAPARILRELQLAVADRGFGAVADVVGAAHRPARVRRYEGPEPYGDPVAVPVSGPTVSPAGSPAGSPAAKAAAKGAARLAGKPTPRAVADPGRTDAAEPTPGEAPSQLGRAAAGGAGRPRVERR